VTAAGSVVVVANPTAGRGRAGRLIGKIDRRLNEAGVAHEIKVSGSADGLQEMVREAAAAGADIVAALGGDGTAGLAADALIGTGATLAVLPSGTADDFAHGLGIKNIDAAVRAIVAGNVVKIDAVRLTTGAERRHYVNVAGCGFDSEVNETANAMRFKLGGTPTYIAAVVKTLSRFAPASFRVELDEDVVEGPHMLVVVGNSISYGGGMKVTPDASVVDGILDVCLLEEVSVPTFLRAFPKVFRGTHTKHPKITMARAKHVKVEADRRVIVYADGERVGSAPAVFEVVPEALPVVVGQNARAIR
jgi:diacylglycerol kinase (ATP)